MLFAETSTGQGIYYANGGQALAIAESGHVEVDSGQRLRFVSFSQHPTVNQRQEIAFAVRFQEGSAVLTRSGAFGEYRWVASSVEAFRDFGDYIAINSTSQVAFSATVDPPGHPDRSDFGKVRLEQAENPENPLDLEAPSRRTAQGVSRKHHEGVFLDQNDNLFVLGGTGEEFLDLEPGLDLNDRGDVAYLATAPDGKLQVVADTEASEPQILARAGFVYQTFGPPSLNDQGHAAFYAEDLKKRARILWTMAGAAVPTVIAEEGEEYAGFSRGVALSDMGTIAFVAQDKEGGKPSLVAVVPSSLRTQSLRNVELSHEDAVHGDPIVAIEIGPRALAGLQSIVAKVRLQSGAEKIVQVPLQ